MPRTLISVATAIILTVSAATVLGDDERIARQIQSGLRSQQDAGLLKDFDLKVRVEDGIVWMKGIVRQPEQRYMALDLASRVGGVEKVVNEIEVSGQDAIPASATIPGDSPLSAVQDASLTTVQEASLNRQVDPAGLQPVPRPSAPANLKQHSATSQTPLAFAPARTLVARRTGGGGGGAGFAGHAGAPLPANIPGVDAVGVPTRYDHANMPGYAWPSYAASPNYAALSYPQQYSAAAWPYIGPFYPYPQVPLGWRKVTLEWDDGWWFLDFQSK